MSKVDMRQDENNGSLNYCWDCDATKHRKAPLLGVI